MAKKKPTLRKPKTFFEQVPVPVPVLPKIKAEVN